MRKTAIRTLLAPSLLGVLAGATSAAGCGVDVNPNDCHATNSCGSVDASTDGEPLDGMVGDDGGDGGEAAPPTEGGPTDGSGMDAPHESGGPCGEGMTSCSGTCVSESNDPNHCGSCTKKCPGPTSGTGSAICVNGACEVNCVGGSVACNGACLPSTVGPSGDPCIISEMYGVFVSPMGSDSAAGTQVAPFKTIAAAMTLAKAASKSVYACGNNGTYNENLVVGSAVDGVKVYGGLDCTTTPSQWKYVAADLASVAPTTAGYALEVQGLATGVTFEDFSFTSLAGVNPGDSSIAVFATGSAGVLLRRATVMAGAGNNGQSQTQAPSMSTAPGGSSGSVTSGGGSMPNTACPTSTGGAGGQPGPSGGDGNDGTPDVASNKGLASAQSCATGSTGGNGANGGVGSDGAGATTWASLSGSGWLPSAGAAGGAGGIAQGGGGGAAVDATGGGGGGGAGGCGGSGGPAGAGGGSSIAVLVYQSSIDVEGCTLNANAPGAGGNGAAGQLGQTGGVHGTGFVNACQGGKGGNGGNGGGGGGGAGGLSAGVVWLGTAPTINGATVSSASTLASVSTAASGGAAGAGGGASNPGMAGTAAAVVQFQ